jgi:hypothetical protein
VYKGFGSERLIWEDGSHWSICAVPAIWGWSATTMLGDEVWDIPLDVIESAVWPTLVERVRPQLWMFSTANDAATSLVPTYRRLALDGSPRVCLMEWSAPPGADPDDPAVWRAATPHWSVQRGEFLAATRRDVRVRQWLNVWPGSETGSEWPVGLSLCPPVPGVPPQGGLGALEVSADRSRYGAAVAVRDGREVLLWSSSHGSLEDAAGWLSGLGPSLVLVGVSLKDQVVGPFAVQPAGVSETRLATPVLQDLVNRGRLRHDHSVALLSEAGVGRTTPTEGGPVLSAKRSGGPIATLKAALWASWAVESGAAVVEEPAVW